MSEPIELENLYNLLKTVDPKPLASIGSPSDSFEVVLDIRQDFCKRKVLGEFVCFHTKEGLDHIYSLGQITEVKTVNKWHEEPSFKSVIKRKGKLPHLSDDADNRLATLNIQSSFKKTIGKTIPTQLNNSPATGTEVFPVNKEFMDSLLEPVIDSAKTIVLGKAHSSDIDIPFWFQHFGEDDNDNGHGDAYHVGVFGKTGSGKTTTAAMMLAGYAANYKRMSFLVFDPQDQFFNDNKVLPDEKSFKQAILEKGIDEEKYKPIRLTKDFCLPDSPELFTEILLSSGFIRKYFNISTEDKKNDLRQSLENYLVSRGSENSAFSISKCNSQKLLEQITKKFIGPYVQGREKKDTEFSTYLEDVYSSSASLKRVAGKLIEHQSKIEDSNHPLVIQFGNILSLFRSKSLSIDKIVNDVLKNPGYFYIISLSSNANPNLRNDNVQALVLDLILSKLLDESEQLSSIGEQANCLIVMDEAHRYVNSSASDHRLKQLNNKIIDSVRTVRKYGIGHMFITQTIDSIDKEVIQQMSVFAFGYGLTMSSEFSTIKQLINDDKAAKFYRSFINPNNNGKYPFMFHGPISPLSFTGSPLFIEMSNGSEADSKESIDSRLVSNQPEIGLNDDVPF